MWWMWWTQQKRKEEEDGNQRMKTISQGDHMPSAMAVKVKLNWNWKRWRAKQKQKGVQWNVQIRSDQSQSQWTDLEEEGSEKEGGKRKEYTIMKSVSVGCVCICVWEDVWWARKDPSFYCLFCYYCRSLLICQVFCFFVCVKVVREEEEEVWIEREQVEQVGHKTLLVRVWHTRENLHTKEKKWMNEWLTAEKSSTVTTTGRKEVLACVGQNRHWSCWGWWSQAKEENESS